MDKPKKKVDIRFNTNFPEKSRYEWRVIVDGVEALCNEIRIKTESFTSRTFIEGQGNKWHISTFADEVEFIDLTETLARNYLKAIIS
jgi:hypothetical protein